MTAEEKAVVQSETRLECARIAAAESQYWAELDDQPAHIGISIGAMAAAANICGAIAMGKSEAQVRDEIECRKKRWGV